MGTDGLVRTSLPEEKPRARSRWTPWVMVIAALIATPAYWPASNTASGASGVARVGSPAPDFTLRLFNGQSVTLSSLKGKPVVVNFWAST